MADPRLRNDGSDNWESVGGIVPENDNDKDLGKLLKYWKDIYFKGSLKDGSSSLALSVIVALAATQTLTNKRITKRTNTIVSSATPTPAGDTTDIFTITALAVGATFAAPTGTPQNGQALIIRIKDDGTARALAYNVIYRAGDIALPDTTIISKTMYLGLMYNSADSKWDLVAYIDNL